MYQGYFGTEQEWDERRIYDHVEVNGTPIDASGNVAYTHPTRPQPHLQSTSGSTQGIPSYVIDGFAWNFYPNPMSLPVRPGPDGSVDNHTITFHLLSDVKVWNGTQFVETGGAAYRQRARAGPGLINSTSGISCGSAGVNGGCPSTDDGVVVWERGDRPDRHCTTEGHDEQ